MPRSTLSKHIDKWKDIGTPTVTLDWLSNGVKLPFREEPEACAFSNHKLTERQRVFVSTELTKLCESGCISEVNYKPHCVVPIGCVPKKKNKLRLIVDLRYVNSFTEPQKFRYEDLSTLSEIIKPGDHMISIDLKDSFHHIPVNEESSEYIGIEFENKYYIWNVLPFGYKLSPFFFCKTMRSVIQYLREKGLRIIIYMDDMILLSDKDSIAEEAEFVQKTLIDLGFHINYDKSSLEPKTWCEFLGFIVDSCGVNGKPILKVPKHKIKKIRKDITRALAKPNIRARQLARLAGQCIAVCRAIFPGKLKLRSVYRLLKSRASWDSNLTWSEDCVNDLKWWIDALHSWNGQVILNGQIQGQIETDASQTGWGAKFVDMEASGVWDTRTSYKSSNFRELLTILLALKSFRHVIKNKHIQILSDNITAIAYLNHMGGPGKDLTQLAQVIWAECLENNIMITARHLPGKNNIAADRLSRLNDKSEWRLHPQIFDMLDVMWGPHTVDRFSSFVTTHLPFYNTRYLDPYSSGVDALAQTDWNQHNNFVNPPFRLLSNVIKTIVCQKAVATVVAPWWPAQPFFHRLQQLSVTPPVKLPPPIKICQKVNRLPEPVRNRSWRLYAWRICGNKDC